MFPIRNPPPSSLLITSLWVVSVHHPQASRIMHRTWTGDLFHIWHYTCFHAIPPKHPTLSLSQSSKDCFMCFIQCVDGYYRIRSDQISRSVMSDSATPWIAAHQASLSITNFQSSLTLMSIESVMPSGHLILCRPLLLLSPIPPSIRVFSNESTLRMSWPKYWSFSFSIITSKEIPGLISFRMDWLDLLAVQGTLKSLLQHHSSKASILQCLAFFTVQLSHPYMTTGKTIALTRHNSQY